MREALFHNWEEEQKQKSRTAGFFVSVVYFSRMPRLLDPVPRPHRRRYSDGARGVVMLVALVLAAAWFVVIGEQTRAMQEEMRDASARLDRFSVRAEAFERDAARP